MFKSFLFFTVKIWNFLRLMFPKLKSQSLSKFWKPKDFFQFFFLSACLINDLLNFVSQNPTSNLIVTVENVLKCLKSLYIIKNLNIFTIIRSNSLYCLSPKCHQKWKHQENQKSKSKRRQHTIIIISLQAKISH